MKFLLALSMLIAVGATSCPNTTATRKTKPLYLLTLVPFPDPRPGAGWDRGLGTVPGARVARDEINNRTDLLPGYHIELIEENIEACSYTSAGIGLINLLKYIVNLPCRPVAAVIGLMCSSHTAIVSPVAGHNGLDLIQLSAANAPLFRTHNNSFPHLWRVLGSGTVYADTTLALMDWFGWRRIAIAYDHGSTYFTNIATYFENLVQHAQGKEIIFSTGMLENNEVILNQIVSDLRNQPARILFVAMNDHMASKLLCRLANKGLTYPNYIWVQVGRRLERILSENNTCKEEDLLRAKHGHIQLQIQSGVANASTILVSGEEYSSYIHKYNNELQVVQREYQQPNIQPDNVFSSVLYDQVWAFALAVDKSLQLLENRNLSIENYSIGHESITRVIEEQIAKLSFQGASGVIKFNSKHGVIATVDIYQVNGTVEDLVGTNVPQLNSEHEVSYKLSLWIDNSSVPDDDPPVKFVMIPFPLTIVLYSAAGLTILFTTVVLFLLLYFKERPEVKATSPYLSILMFIGCYLMSFAAIFRTTYGSFLFSRNETYGALVTLDNFFMLSGFIMVVITVFFKQLRIYHIFSHVTLKMRKVWRTCSLVTLVIALSFWISLVYIVAEVVTPVDLDYYNYTEVEDNIATTKRVIVYPARYSELNIFFKVTTSLYIAIFLFLIVYLAIRTRKIARSQFKDTKKLNLFVATIVVGSILSSVLDELLAESHAYWQDNVATSTLSLGMVFCIFGILFLPKLLPVMFKPTFQKLRTPRHSTGQRPQYGNSPVHV